MEYPIKIAVTDRHNAKKYKNIDTTWSAIKERCHTPVRTTETVLEYPKLPKARQNDIKDIGGMVGGHLKGGIRKNGNVISRRIIALDADHVPVDVDFPFLVSLVLPDIEWFIHSTHRHTTENQRFRLEILLERDCGEDEYPVIARQIANQIGIDYFDDSTYQANRMMYWPSCPADGEFVFVDNEGTPFDPDKYLNIYADWRDCTLWPTSNRQSEIIQRSIKQQQDPHTKDGVVGAFCRIYTIESVIETLLADVYGRKDDLPENAARPTCNRCHNMV